MKKKQGDLTGMQFGRLEVLEQIGMQPYRGMVYRCRCICGKEKEVVGRDLLRGAVKSCGCLARENLTKANKTGGYRKETLCFSCVRSAAPPSLQCEWDRTGGIDLPKGAEIAPVIGDRVRIVHCPQYLSIRDIQNRKLLQEERLKNNAERHLEEELKRSFTGQYLKKEVAISE